MSENPDRNITDNSGAVATDNTIGRDLNQYVNSTVLHQYFREVIRRLRLDSAYVEELLRTYEPPPGRDQAAEVLGRHHAVVLIGGEGIGRRTTAVQLLHERNVTLHELVPEPGQDLTAEPPCEPRCGYLYAADALDATSIQDYAARLRDNGSYLVVWTTQDVTQHTGTFAADIGIRLEPPLPENVFRRNLTAHLRAAEAAWWRDRQDLEPIIKGAHPADVVRLVKKLILPTMAVHGCTEAAVADLVEAYRNWEDHLQIRFAPSALSLRERVRLIAVAMVEDAPEQAAYEAAAALGEKLGVSTEEGHGLAGAGTRCLRDGDEIRWDDGIVRFAKPAFAESVLEYVARTYPEAWRQVREWTIELPRRLSGDPDVPSVLARLARTVVRVAGRRDDLELVRRATEGWSTSGTRPLAVELLGMAAVDTALGRGTRQWMYDSAYYRRGTVPTLTAIAEACARYGAVYPENALTRLRHLAAVEQETVRKAVRQAVTDLACDDRVRVRILEGLGTWLQDTKGRAVGCEAFLDVMETRDDQDRIATIGEAARRRADRLSKALGKSWGAALVELATTDRARALIATWLDDALTSLQAGDADRSGVVVRILGQAAGDDPRYLPRLVRAVDAWYARSEQTPDRTAIRRTLIDTATSNDPLLSAPREEGTK